MADAIALTAEVVVDAMTDIVLARFLSGSAVTLVLYDWLLVLSDEFSTIWKANWTLPKFLYYYIRIVTAPFIILMAYQLSDLRGPLTRDLYRMGGPGYDPDAVIPCGVELSYRRFTWFITGFFVATFITTLGLMIAALITYEKTIDYYDIVGLCGALHAAPTFPAMFYAPAAYEAFLFVTTAYRAYQDAAIFSSSTTAPFLIMLYRDGLICFLVMLGMRSWNIWIYCTQPVTSLNIGGNMMWAINTIMSTRVYLNLVFLVKKPDITTYDTQAICGNRDTGIQFRRGAITTKSKSFGNRGDMLRGKVDELDYDEEHSMGPMNPRRHNVGRSLSPRAGQSFFL
ncbi:hypothetical protein M408DRAFT_20802 [Serendipita vermifera MAFF 305830]|uniref:DUF6533 domain-containing protein n=1 Tax=Serendipita vermifera MAFF 305830 TaxID=933852 RepID=A0A0C2X2P3_SERVB|nr:hypothetical protein M408DRAFT_20802 [Serendipita vermifera MAFF 305830]